MKSGITILGLVSIVLFMVSCGPHISKEKMAQIDKLSMQLDSVDQRVHAIDSARAMNAASIYEQNLAYMQYDLKDTLPREEAFFVDTYYRLRKGFRQYSASYNQISNEIRITKQQLEDLRFDAENGLLEEKHFDDYIALETENVHKVSSAANDMMSKIELVLPLYEKKNPRIDSLLLIYKVPEASEE